MNDKNYDIDQIFEMPFPIELSGEVIDGISVEMLTSDSLRLIDAFNKQSQLTNIQTKVLKQCSEELHIITKKVEKTHKSYFCAINHAINDICSKIT